MQIRYNTKYLNLTIIMALFILSLFKYSNLSSSFYDLGIFQWQIFNNDIYGLGVGHLQFFQPIYSFLGINGYILVLSQTFLILSSLWFIFKIADRYKNFCVLIFLLCYAIWYNILFDFHFDHLLFPLLFAFYYYLKNKKYKIAFFIALVVPLVKEPFALTTSFMGIYIALKYKQYLKGGFLFLYGLVYFYIAVKIVIPFFTNDYLAVGNFGSGGDIFDVVLYPITHFKEFVITFVTSKKILYIAVLLLSFGLIIPFFSAHELLVAIPSLLISILSSLENYYWYNTHYTAPLVAPFMVAFIYGLPKAINFIKIKLSFLNNEQILFFIFSIVLLAHIVFSPSPISRFFWLDKLPQYYYETYVYDNRTKNIKNAILKYIPLDKNISVSTQNNLNLSHLAYRKYYFAFPDGILSDKNITYIDEKNIFSIIASILKSDKSMVKTKAIKAEYVIIDTKRDLYLIDKRVNKNKFLEILQEMKEKYSIIFKYDGFYIFYRKKG